MRKTFLDEPGALWSGLGSFLLWGLLPIYWKLLIEVPAFEILCHRIVWSAIFSAVVIALSGGWKGARQALRNPRNWGMLAGTSVLLAFNWGLYIWAVNAGFVLETSLGYFVLPLFGMLLGMLVLGERILSLQKIAILMIVAAVSWMTLEYGRVPWIALSLSVTFAFYTLTRKRIQVEALDALFLESLFLVLPALVYLGWLEWNGTGSFLHSTTRVTWLLGLSGVATATPLLLFTSAVRKLDLTVIGVIQYLSPTCQFLLAIFLYHEPLGMGRLAAFVVIWAAVALYLGSGIRGAKRGRKGKKKEEIEEMPI